MENLKISLFFLFSFSIGLFGCGVQSSQEATAQALSESISLTATSSALQAVDADEKLATAQAQATNSSLAIDATRMAGEQISAEAMAVTATAVAPILAELSLYGVDPSKGRAGWIHPPVTLDIQGYLQYDYANYFIATVASDFVVSADITWDTSYGTSGCGFVLRSDGNEDALNQYLAIATRGGNGRVIFSSMVKGDVKNVIDHYAYGRDPQFDWQNGTTNRITVVARGGSFTIFTNGTNIGEVKTGSPPVLVLPAPPEKPPEGSPVEEIEKYEEELSEYDELIPQMKLRHQQSLAFYQPDTPYFERGFVALVALSESGRTICKFDNAWFFIIDQ